LSDQRGGLPEVRSAELACGRLGDAARIRARRKARV